MFWQATGSSRRQAANILSSFLPLSFSFMSSLCGLSHILPLLVISHSGYHLFSCLLTLCFCILSVTSLLHSEVFYLQPLSHFFSRSSSIFTLSINLPLYLIILFCLFLCLCRFFLLQVGLISEHPSIQL